MWRLGASGLGPPGDGRIWQAIPTLRAKPAIALPPSQQSWLADVTTPPKAVVTDARLSLGRTASVVAPLRSRATRMGICSPDSPRLAALPPRLRAARGRSERLPLNDSRMKVSSASTMPFSRAGLSNAAAARNRWRQRNAVLPATPQRLAALERFAIRFERERGGAVVAIFTGMEAIDGAALFG